MYFAPACTLLSIVLISSMPTFLSAAVDGLICMMPTAPAGLLRSWRRPDSWNACAASISQSKSNILPYL